MSDDAVMRNRQLPDRFILRRESVEVFVRGQQAFEGSLLLLHPTGNDRDIFTLRLARGKLVLELADDGLTLAKHEQSRHAAIQTVNRKCAATLGNMPDVSVNFVL